MQAVRKYDPYRGVKLSSYAAWWIRAYILKFILNNWRLVKIGTTQAQRKLFFNLRKEKERLEQLGFQPEPALLADRLDVRERDVIEMETRMGSPEASLDAPMAGVDGEGARTRHDLVADMDQARPDVRVEESEFTVLLRQKLEAFARHPQGPRGDHLPRALADRQPADPAADRRSLRGQPRARPPAREADADPAAQVPGAGVRHRGRHRCAQPRVTAARPAARPEVRHALRRGHADRQPRGHHVPRGRGSCARSTWWRPRTRGAAGSSCATWASSRAAWCRSSRATRRRAARSWRRARGGRHHRARHRRRHARRLGSGPAPGRARARAGRPRRGGARPVRGGDRAGGQRAAVGSLPVRRVSAAQGRGAARGCSPACDASRPR